MSLIVQKFGGTSVRDAKRIRNVAGIIAETYLAGNDVIVVLSAQGDTTDDLIAKAEEINPPTPPSGRWICCSPRESKSLWPLCAMALEAMGLPCISLAAWQVGDTVYLRPLRRPDQEDRHRAYPVRAGPAPDRDRHRLPGRGPQRGRDHPGPGRVRHQRRGAGGGLPCRSVPDLHGCGRCVYHGPRIVPSARKLDEITYDEMLELASQGAQVLHNRSVELAKKFRVNLEVVSSLGASPARKSRRSPKWRKPISPVSPRTPASPASP